MAKATRICRTCGKEYEYCHTERPANIFRWQEVACSPECGEKYLAAILESRGEVARPTADNRNDSLPGKKAAKKKYTKTDPETETVDNENSLTD